MIYHEQLYDFLNYATLQFKQRTIRFVKELTRIIPNSTPLWRKNASIKKTVKQAIANGYTDIMVINEDNRMPNGLVVTHLPEGPTAHFKLSNVKITKDIKRDWREITSHRPEVILNNFTTRLGKVFQNIFPVKSQCTVRDSVILTFFFLNMKIGHSVARMLAVLFHYDPQFRGKRAVTFHNQRDYIFFRHHR